jgi:hypothetical protein
MDPKEQAEQLGNRAAAVMVGGVAVTGTGALLSTSGVYPITTGQRQSSMNPNKVGTANATHPLPEP